MNYWDNIAKGKVNKAKVGEYTAYAYGDCLLGKTIYNVNVVKNGRNIMHCTTTKLYSTEMLEEMLKGFINECL